MKLGFLGTGKITRAVVEGLCTSDIHPLSVALSPRNEATSTQLAQRFSNVQRMQSNQAVVDHADTVCVAVRPDQAADMLSPLDFKARHRVISFVPFLTIKDLTQVVAPAQTACRAIPLPTVVNHTCPIPVFPRVEAVMDLFGHIGQPLAVDSESELHALWTVTGLISPFYTLLGELSHWAVSKGAHAETASQFTADMFHCLSQAAQNSNPIEFEALARHAATPNGMNEQADKEIGESGAHQAYTQICDKLLKRFPTLGSDEARR